MAKDIHLKHMYIDAYIFELSDVLWLSRDPLLRLVTEKQYHESSPLLLVLYASLWSFIMFLYPVVTNEFKIVTNSRQVLNSDDV